MDLYICCKILVWKDKKKQKEAGMAHFIKKQNIEDYVAQLNELQIGVNYSTTICSKTI